MNTLWIPVWKKAPFIRLLLPLMAGIIVEWYLRFELPELIIAGSGFLTGILAFQFLPVVLKFKLTWLLGILMNLLLVALGATVTYQKDIRHHSNWYGNFYNDSDHIVATIITPIHQKNKFSRAEVLVEKVIHNDSICHSTGSMIIYFEDSSQSIALKYGDRILIDKAPDKIKNTGNPGGFDFARYCAFRNIFHSTFLKRNNRAALSNVYFWQLPLGVSTIISMV